MHSRSGYSWPCVTTMLHLSRRSISKRLGLGDNMSTCSIRSIWPSTRYRDSKAVLPRELASLTTSCRLGAGHHILSTSAVASIVDGEAHSKSRTVYRYTNLVRSTKVNPSKVVKEDNGLQPTPQAHPLSLLSGYYSWDSPLQLPRSYRPELGRRRR